MVPGRQRPRWCFPKSPRRRGPRRCFPGSSQGPPTRRRAPRSGGGDDVRAAAPRCATPSTPRSVPPGAWGRPPPPTGSPWRFEEQPIHQLAVAQGQGAELVRQGEDDMEVRHGQQVGLAAGQPGRSLDPTALRAASVAAGMIVVSDLAAVIAPGDVPAQGGGAAHRQVLEGVSHVRALGPAPEERGPVLPEDLTEGQRRSSGAPAGAGGRAG